jgi:hypothetical protein
MGPHLPHSALLMGNPAVSNSSCSDNVAELRDLAGLTARAFPPCIPLVALLLPPTERSAARPGPCVEGSCVAKSCKGRTVQACVDLCSTCCVYAGTCVSMAAALQSPARVGTVQARVDLCSTCCVYAGTCVLMAAALQSPARVGTVQACVDLCSTCCVYAVTCVLLAAALQSPARVETVQARVDLCITCGVYAVTYASVRACEYVCMHPCVHIN